ncbi:MAG: hypothetical protein WDN06_03170 [Asticcacaulis sp.]
MAKIIAATVSNVVQSAATIRSATWGCAAAEHLLAKLGWSHDTISLLIVVDADARLSAALHGLRHAAQAGPEHAYVRVRYRPRLFGLCLWLSVATAMMQAAGMARVLLVTGDITTRMISDDNRALAPLFGDAVAVTALELSEYGSIAFDLGSDGSGAPYLISKTGGLAQPARPSCSWTAPRSWLSR